MSWAALAEAIRRRGGATFWWRDDDAACRTPALERLLGHSEAFGIPLALAVVPRLAEPRLFEALGETVCVLQHGTDHRNRAAPGEKKTEFPAAEDDAAALGRLAGALERLRAMAGERFLPVLVPPWNRIRPRLLEQLPRIGVRGASGYGARQRAALPQVNTHVDIVAWREGRRFIGEEAAIAAALRALERNEPLGWLTHHAVHDADAWAFVERLLALEGVRWASAAELFSYTAPAHG